MIGTITPTHPRLLGTICCFPAGKPERRLGQTSLDMHKPEWDRGASTDPSLSVTPPRVLSRAPGTFRGWDIDHGGRSFGPLAFPETRWYELFKRAAALKSIADVVFGRN
jgi:hypothetical protein